MFLCSGQIVNIVHDSKVAARLASKGLPEAVMIDCSHGNSLKNHLKQADVVDSMAEQLTPGSRTIVGATIEGHLVEGRQDYGRTSPSTARASRTPASRSSKPNHSWRAWPTHKRPGLN